MPTQIPDGFPSGIFLYLSLLDTDLLIFYNSIHYLHKDEFDRGDALLTNRNSDLNYDT